MNRSITLAGTMLAALGLALAGCDDSADETTTETPAAESAAEAPATGSGPAQDDVAQSNPPTAAPEPAETADPPPADGSPALAAIAGEWDIAVEEEAVPACENETTTISAETIALPDRECTIAGSTMESGTLTLQMNCGGGGEESWTVEGAQDEANPTRITLVRPGNETAELARCE